MGVILFDGVFFDKDLIVALNNIGNYFFGRFVFCLVMRLVIDGGL